MFKKETEYALRSMVYIQIQNNKGRKPGVDEISRESEVPRFFIAKILNRLVKMGFLYSAKGKGGGFFFDNYKSSVKIIDLVNSIEGNNIISACIFGLKHCSHENPCPLHDKYSVIRGEIEELLKSETITSLAMKYAGNAEIAISKRLDKIAAGLSQPE